MIRLSLSVFTAVALSASLPGLAVTPQLASSADSSLALKSDGALWAWGDNGFGQLGNGSVADSTTPVLAAGISGAAGMASGRFHSAAVKVDGSVWAWGYNGFGQLGNGSTNDSTTAVQVAGLGGVVSVATGLYHTLALKTDGTVWSWGSNSFGQLGNGTTDDASVPVQVAGLAGVQLLGAGLFHGVALKLDGTVWSWGANFDGQLGDGSNEGSKVPIQISGFGSVTAVTAGSDFNLALKGDGTVWGWGANAQGQLGDGTTNSSNKPVQVPGFGGVRELAAGSTFSMALRHDGSVWAWGGNQYGQLGDGTTADAKIPLFVKDLAGIEAIAAGQFHALALKSDGTVWAWGHNGRGQLGNGSTLDAASPVQVLGSGGNGFLNLLSSRLFNISTRMQVLTGNDVMIAGFIVGGSTPKTVVINVAGPHLASFGIANYLANPTLVLVRSSDQTVIATNDNWQTAANAAAIQASGFAPNNPLEPAIMMTLAPGAYTAIVQGAGGGTGVGLVGVFEVDRPEVPLINISTRGQVLTGNDVMIAGFIVQGDSAKTVVVNVAGPHLANFGIANYLANPTLVLVRSSDQAVIATNDNWQTAANSAAIQASGFAPNNPLEPAIMMTLAPGAYTAIVQGAGGGTGVGLVGVFTVP